MKKLIVMLSLMVSLLGIVGYAGATVLDFEGLVSAGSQYQLIPNGYGGLNWANMGALDVTSGSNYLNSGYGNGLVSGENVAFNWGSNMAVTSGSVFDFNGAYLTGAWNDGLSVEVKGFFNGSLLYDTTVVTSAFTAQYFAFNYIGVDRLEFSSFGGTHVANWTQGSGTHFAMDNFRYNESVPEPATLFLLGFGLIGLAGLRRKI